MIVQSAFKKLDKLAAAFQQMHSHKVVTDRGFQFLPRRACGCHPLSSLSVYVRSLTWMSSSKRTASLIFWRDVAVACPAASLSNFASISFQLNGRVGSPA